MHGMRACCISFVLTEVVAPLQKLKPEWAKAATQMKAHDETVVVGKVSAFPFLCVENRPCNYLAGL